MGRGEREIREDEGESNQNTRISDYMHTYIYTDI